MAKVRRSIVRITTEAAASLSLLAPGDPARRTVARRAVEWLLRQEDAVQLLVVRSVSQRTLCLAARETLRRLGRTRGESTSRSVDIPELHPAPRRRPMRTLLLPASTVRALARYCDDRCLDAAAVVSRLLTWLAAQSLLVRTVVLGRRAPDLDTAVATILLRKAVHRISPTQNA